MARITNPPPATLDALLQAGLHALAEGRVGDAADACRQVLERAPRLPQAHFLVGLVALERRDWHTAVRAFGSVTAIEPGHAAAWAHLARAWLQTGEFEHANAALREAVARGSHDPLVTDLVGTVHSLLGDQSAALAAYDQACAARPRHPPFEINRANTLVYLGRMEDATTALERALATDPANPHAHWLLANAGRAVDRRHIDRIEALIREDPPADALAFLAYAAGKEYEDLQDWPRAFASFARGATARRSLIAYDEAGEEDLFAALHDTFTADWFAARGPGDPDEAPIFIVGQPRSGTTLVERIVTSHSAVHSAGELQQFRLALRRLTRVQAPARLSADVVRAARDLDVRALGARYLATTQRLRGGHARFVDKMPTNFLLVPLLAAALPNARIVHVTRGAMDTCFANFKQLFADAYFHSYDLREMGRHFARYHRLMQAWRERCPGRVIEVRYEDAVSNLEPVARRLIAALQLPWEDACLDFHLQRGAVATASAVQVREPAHTRSVGRWHLYGTALEPLRQVLHDAGIGDE